jgi:hypothetical protein
MSTAEPEPQSCWECSRRKIVRLPCGGEYVDCAPTQWKWHSCAARLLDTIEKPLLSSPVAPQVESSPEGARVNPPVRLDPGQPESLRSNPCGEKL